MNNGAFVVAAASALRSPPKRLSGLILAFHLLSYLFLHKWSENMCDMCALSPVAAAEVNRQRYKNQQIKKKLLATVARRWEVERSQKKKRCQQKQQKQARLRAGFCVCLLHNDGSRCSHSGQKIKGFVRVFEYRRGAGRPINN